MVSHTCNPGQCIVTDNRTTVSLKIFSFLRTKYSLRWNHLSASTIASLSGLYRCSIAMGGKKMQTREMKLRPKPEGIKIKFEPVIFGSILGSLI